MAISLHDILAPTLLGGLNTLSAVIGKAAAHAEANALDARALLDARLYEDMLTFTRQIQVATDTARRGLDRLVAEELSSVADDETTFDDLAARVTSTIERVKAVDRAALDGAIDLELTVSLGSDVTLPFTGRSYALGYLIPNFLFHVTTAYGIMRHRGVVLGKRDFLAPFIGAASTS